MKISIPKPCHEDWNKMTELEKGRFCDVCNKCVYDLSKFKDDEILNLVQQNDVCVKVSTNHLKKINQNHSNRNLTKFLQLSSFAFLFGTIPQIYGQEKQSIEIVGQKNEGNISIEYRNQIYDTEGFVLPDVIVEIKDTEIQVFADENGEFSFKLPENLYKPILIITDLNGIEREFYLDEIGDKKIIFDPEYKDLIIIGTIIRSKSFFGRVWSGIKFPFQKIGRLF